MPPCGHYEVNYESIKKRVRTPSFKERERKVFSPSSNCSVLSYSPDYHPRVSSPDFSKQLSRSQLKTPAFDVSEHRFDEFRPDPPISTRVHRVSTPDISRNSQRSFAIYKVREYSPEYTPSYRLSQPDLGKGVVPFNLVKGRSPTSSHIHDLSYEAKYDFVEKKSSSPDIGKSKRHSSKHSENLPSYMQHSPTRIGLISINDKAFEMNSFYGAISNVRYSRPNTSEKSTSQDIIGSFIEGGL